MDIAITLPLDLWKKIVAGEKTIELRKNFPKEFDVVTDRVYVILKGTTLIAGYFVVSSFENFRVEGRSDFYPFLTQIAMPKQWIFDYWGYSPTVYFWHIRYVNPFVNLVDRRSVWNIKTNPQSFFYVN